MVFEVENLNNASPATVSRCGIIFVSSTNLGWRPLLETWCNGLHPRFVEDTKIIPHLDTVAGEALLRFSTSKTILQNSDIGILSALARVRILLSSRTVLRFSIQMASTGPSQIIHETCLFCLLLHFFQIYEKIPGTQSLVVMFIIPYIS
jgi:hypothetical protein